MSYLKKFSISLAALTILIAPQLAGAQPVNNTTGDKGLGSDDPSSSFFQLVSCSGVDDPRTTDKKEVVCDYNQLVATAFRAVKFVLYMLVPILLIMIVYTGWQYLTAGGDTMKLEGAKKMFKPLFLGVVLIFCAWLIVYTILDKFITDDPRSGINKSRIVPTNK